MGLLEKFVEGLVLRLDAGDLGFLEGLFERLAGDGPLVRGDVLHDRGAAAQLGKGFRGGGVPDPDRTIGAAGDKHLAIGGELVIQNRDLAGLGDLLEEGLVGGLRIGGGGRVG